MTKLVTIPFSHYCEKARWALDRCGVAYEEDGHLPVFHYLATFRNRGNRTVPVLVDGKTVVRDSTDIVAWADARRPGTLIPVAGADQALAIEDDLDEHFGPATRRLGYYYLLPNRAADKVVAAGVPAWERVAMKVARPLAVSFLKRGLAITPQGAERSRKRIDHTFARVGEILRDGRKFLTGDRFTVADLTFAALASPVLLPPDHPLIGKTITLELFPAEARALIEGWRATPAGRFALRLYADERAPVSRAA